MMERNKMHVLIVEDNKPVVPQLVPLTIRWVEADRAHRVTFSITLMLLVVALILSLAGFSAVVILRSVLFGALVQVAVRSWVRYDARRKLDEMRRLLEST